MSPQATEEVSYREAVRSDGCKNGTSSAPKSFPLRGRWRRRRRKRCRTGSQFLSTDAEAERKSPLPSSGLRETPDATLPSRGGILRAARSDGRENGTSSAPKSFPLRGRCRRRRRKRCRIDKQYLSTDAEAQRKSPLPSSGLRETPNATLPSRGGILRAARFDGCKNGTSSTPMSFPLRGRCRRRRRKRCRIEKRYLSTEARAERRSPLPSSGLRETPDATLPSRGGILRRSRGGILRGVQASWGNRRSTASRAAACSARFLLVPVPCPTSLPLSRTRTEKVLSWSGPVSPVSS